MNKRSFGLLEKSVLLFITFAMLTVVLLALATRARAAGTTAVVNWVAPTAYVDGTALPLKDIATFNVSWTVKGDATVVGTKAITAPTLSASLPGLTCGVYTISVTDTLTSAAANPGATSAPAAADYDTGIVCVKPLPNPPGAVAAK